MTTKKLFDHKIALPDDNLSQRATRLLGFQTRYNSIERQLQLLLNANELTIWNREHYSGKLILCELISEQYPFIIFYGDVGTGKTATAECIANKLVSESKITDSILFKLSNRVRGNGMVGEMGTLLTEAFEEVVKSAGKGRRSILIIDEGDSLAASRDQANSHHEDKVAVNTLIQKIDDLRQYKGRIVVILCTNRLSALDPALHRRATIIEEFKRPTIEERQRLFSMDLDALKLKTIQCEELARLTKDWTYSDIRTKLYPIALSKAFPKRALKFEDLKETASSLKASPIIEG